MKKRTFYWLLLILLLIGASLISIYYAWNKPHQNIETAEGMKISSNELFREFSENEKQATEKYNGKVLEVSGTVTAVETNQEGQTIIRLQTDDLMFGINCTMEKKTTVKKGSAVIIKGSCSGFTTDVILIHCYFIK